MICSDPIWFDPAGPGLANQMITATNLVASPTVLAVNAAGGAMAALGLLVAVTVASVGLVAGVGAYHKPL
jgi:hypothetical protein